MNKERFIAAGKGLPALVHVLGDPGTPLQSRAVACAALHSFLLPQTGLAHSNQQSTAGLPEAMPAEQPARLTPKQAPPSFGVPPLADLAQTAAQCGGNGGRGGHGGSAEIKPGDLSKHGHGQMPLQTDPYSKVYTGPLCPFMHPTAVNVFPSHSLILPGPTLRARCQT